MLCSVCKGIALEDKEISPGLNAYNCPECMGNWIRYRDYEEWKNSENNTGFAQNEVDYNPEYDSKKANLCPDCGRILIKYKVSNELPFSVDHCGSCNGLWLDRSEWELIIKNNLHLQMNKFFTDAWQSKIRSEMTAKRFEEGYIRKFGEDGYQKLKEIREWIYGNEKKEEMIAYLMDENPYKL